jgi:glutaredoxin
MSNHSLQLPNSNDEWTLYGATWCKWCTKAKELFEQFRLNYTYVQLSDNKKDAQKQIKSVKEVAGGYQKIPQVYHYGKFVGGFTAFKSYLESLKEKKNE